MAVNFISDFEEKLSELAKSRGCNGIICGHIHKPDIKVYDGITYMIQGTGSSHSLHWLKILITIGA